MRGLGEAAPVGGDVAGVADRDAERVELGLELLEQLEGGRLLALDAQLVDRVDERDGVALDEFPHELQRGVEVGLERDHASAVDQRLGELAGGDLALGHDHGAAQARSSRIGGGRGGGVAGRGAHDRLAPSLTAAETAQVMPRSLKEPVGLAPSSFRNTSAPALLRAAGL